MIFQKKEKPRRRRFANFKKICIWGLGSPQQAWKGISLSPACNRCGTMFIYNFLFFLFYLLIDCFIQKNTFKIFVILLENRFENDKRLE